ncbi:MAG: hypothetical protein KF835_06255 [Xanthobacteraceae bacterium]|nr:hypothetical protein [Xanthobacteraceae bacterium]
MTAAEWLYYILLGGVMGVLGQGIRATVGLKKVNEQADLEKLNFSNVFELPLFLTSIALGFTAGAAAALASYAPGMTIDIKFLMALAVAGYTGSDFIESFVKSHLPARFKSAPVANSLQQRIGPDVVFRPVSYTAARRSVDADIIAALAACGDESDPNKIKLNDKLSKLGFDASECSALPNDIVTYLATEGWTLTQPEKLDSESMKPSTTVARVISLVKAAKPVQLQAQPRNLFV